MDELADKWEGLSDIAQASITELIAGKHQGNVMSSLMANFDIARNALETSQNSAGSALAEHAKWSESLEARLNKLKATWQSLSQSFLKSDFLKGGISALTGFVDVIDGLVSKIGTIPTLLGAFAIGKVGKNFISLASDITSVSDAVYILKELFPTLSRVITSCMGALSKAMTSFMTAFYTAGGGAGGLVAGFGSLISMLNPITAIITVIAATIGAIGYSAYKSAKEAEKLAEKVGKVTSEYKNNHNELKNLQKDYDTTNEDSMISKYAKLSKGVDDFGNNLSLTADEYAEYQNIVGTIADQIPSLISGYDSQGNAILSCKDNISDLVAEYEKLIHLQNQEILTKNGGDIENSWNNTLSQASGYDGWEELGNTYSMSWLWGDDDLTVFDMKESTAEWLNSLTPSTSEKDIKEAIGGWTSYRRAEVIQALQNAGYDVDHYSDISKELSNILKTEPQQIKNIVDSYYAGFDDDIASYKTKATALLSEAFDVSSAISGLNYGNISEKLQDIAYQTVNSLDYESLSKITQSGKTITEWTTEMLDSLNSISKVDNTKLETAFDLKTQFNGGDISYGEYVTGLQEVNDLVGNLVDQSSIPTEVGDTIKNALNIDGVVEQYEALSNFLQNDLKFDKSGAEDFLNSLSAEEFAVLMDIKPELDANATASDIQNMIDKEMALRGLTVKLDIEVEKTNIEAVTTALSEMVTGAGMSSESISAVESMFKNIRGYDPSKLFERTANGIRLNREEFNKLNSEYSKTNLAELNKEMSSLGDIYNQTRKELYNLAYGTDEYNAKLAELDNIENQINSTEKLITQYKGLTSAYQQWQIAESSGNERDMYESVIYGFETVKDELSRGWADDGTREFMQLLRGETATIIDGKGQAKEINIATASAKELKQVWDDLDKTIEHTAEGGHKGYSLRDFFTTDKDGNATSKGVYNFLDAIGHMEEEVFGGIDELVERDDKGNIIGFNFDLVGGDEVIAEALGISEELVQIMVRAAGDAGFVVSFDGTYQQLDVLREKAQLAAESMNKILEGDNKKTIEIDMNADTVKEIQPQIDSIMKTFGAKDSSGKLTGAIDMSINGAEDALTVVSTLQSMKDRLERPAYMNIQVNQVEDDLKEPLKNLQDYRTKIEQLNQAKLHGADTTELEASIKESKDKVVADLLEIQENNPELSGQLKIEGLSKEDIESKVEKGEITIPATIDIQLEMDEKLGILVDKALLDAGKISQKEFDQRVDIYLSGGEVDTSDVKNDVQESIDKVVKGVNNGTTTVEPDVKVNPDVKESESDTKVQDAVDKVVKGVNSGTTTVEPNLNVNPNVNKDNAETSIQESIDKVVKGVNNGTTTVEPDVKVNANVDTSNAEKEVSDKTKKAVENQSGETTTVEKDVQLEFNINDYVDELSKFKDVAKELEGLEDITVKMNVNLEGELNSDTISNLSEFAEGAKTLQGVWDKDNTVSVGVKFIGNTLGNMPLEDLTKFADGAKALKGANESTSVTVTANLGGNLDQFKGDIDDLTTFADAVNDLKGINGEINVTVTASITKDGFPDATALSNLEKFANVVNTLPTSAVTVSVNASVDTDKINKAISALETLSSKSNLFKTYSANIKVTATPTNTNLGDEFTGTGEATMEPDKTDFGDVFSGSGTATMTPNTYDFGHVFSGSGTVTLSYSLSGDGTPVVDGTAHVDGTAFAGGTAKSGRAFKAGDWGTKESGVALMGELGRELIVRDGRFFTVGDDGAGFYPYKKGDIIFNHRQTEELFKNGYVTSNGGRGRTFASGTALVEGTAFFTGSTGTGGGFWSSDDSSHSSSNSSSSSSINSSKKSKKNSDDEEEEFEETLDWIEIKIDRIERVIDQLDTKANSIYRSWIERNKNLADQISKVGEEISIQQQAYDKYIQAANDVGLDESYARRVREGRIRIETIDDEDLKEKIDEYKEFYEKALDCKDAILELKETESELYAQRVENAATQYEGILGVIEHEKNMLEEYINQSEAQAWFVSSKYYDALANNERETIIELENQKAEMLNAFNEAMDSGTIAEGSESWYEMCASIDEVTLAIQESKTQLLEYEQTVEQLGWDIFDVLHNRISAVTEETEFLINLLSNDKLHDDNGQLTNEGSATMGLHGVAYNTYMHQADLAAEEIARLKKELEQDPFDTELEERYREMISLQQEYILSAENERDAIKSLVEEGIQLEIEALQERIDKYNEALQSEKDLYDYQKKVKEQTKEIASLEKQMAAYQGDDSEEARQKIQKIKVDLEEARADLEETEYDKFIDDSEKLLDNLLLEYEETLNMRIDDINALIADMIAEINTDAGVIGDTIRESANSVGYTLTDSMKTIWDEDATNTKNVITTYGDKFVNAQTTTNNALNSINTNLQNILSQLNEKAKTNVKSASTSSVAKSSSSTTATTKTTTNKSSGGDGTPKIGDRVKYVSGQYYYDSQGKKPLGSHNQGEYVYITNINTKDWATHGYHISTGKKLGDGDLGWLKLNQISGYATGKKRFVEDEVAWTQEDGKEFIVRPSDGAILTPIARGDSILTASASKNIWSMANSPAEFIKDNLKLDKVGASNNSNIQSSYTQHFDKVVFNLPNVKNYDELLSAMQKDRNFERLIRSMTIDQIAGKSSLGKGKSIR